MRQPLDHSQVELQFVSLRSKTAALLACDHDLAGPAVAFKTTETLRATANRCADLAETAQATAPTFALSHLVAAQSAMTLGQLDLGRTHLERSRTYARFEGWLAQKRFVLSLRNNLPTATSDVQTLLSTQFGTEFLARHYLANPALRDTIGTAALDMNGHIQQRLLNLLTKYRAGA